nr:RNA-directed DNA polymerase, eukaryota [Tanacetum cinerariifolium]
MVLLLIHSLIGPDFYMAVKWFFDHGGFAIGCNSSFVTLIPKVLDPKTVSDFHPISLIGSLYKVVTKILATRSSLVISDLISDVQSAFIPNRQIIDGPFIINEVLSRCKSQKQQAMIFKVDFAKAYDSVRWDFLDDVLNSFGFGGLKQGDPLDPFLFLLIMEALHLSFSRAVDAGIFSGYKIDSSTTLSHLFYADDAVFIGEWSHSNLRGIMNILRCFSLLSAKGVDLISHCKIRVGKGTSTSFWNDLWIGDSLLKVSFPRLFALEENKDILIADKLNRLCPPPFVVLFAEVKRLNNSMSCQAE